MSAPNRIDIVEAVHRDHPGLIHRPHDFTAVVCAALHAVDPRFGLNGKRGNPHDRSEDCTAYLDDTSPLVGSDGRRIRIIDFIAGANGPSPSPAWIDQTQATIAAGTTGVWVQPDRVAPAPTPTPTPTPSPQPPPAPPSTDLSAIKAQLASLLEVIQVLVAGQATLGAQIAGLQTELHHLIGQVVVADHLDDLKRRVDAARAAAEQAAAKAAAAEQAAAKAAAAAQGGGGKCRLPW